MANQRRIIWTREAETSFVEAVREHPTLWDHQHEKYKLKRHRRNLFSSVAERMNSLYPQLGTFTADIVRKKFGNLKDYYMREKKKHVKPSGAGGEAIPKWELYKSLEFLDKSSEYSSNLLELKSAVMAALPLPPSPPPPPTASQQDESMAEVEVPTIETPMTKRKKQESPPDSFVLEKVLERAENARDNFVKKLEKLNPNEEYWRPFTVALCKELSRVDPCYSRYFQMECYLLVEKYVAATEQRKEEKAIPGPLYSNLLNVDLCNAVQSMHSNPLEVPSPSAVPGPSSIPAQVQYPPQVTPMTLQQAQSIVAQAQQASTPQNLQTSTPEPPPASVANTSIVDLGNK